jgi:hypothetical protein
MAATMGMLVQETSRFEGFLAPSANLKFSDVPNGLAALDVVPLEGWCQMAAVIGAHEFLVQERAGKGPGDYGTGYFGVALDDQSAKQLRLLVRYVAYCLVESAPRLGRPTHWLDPGRRLLTMSHILFALQNVELSNGRLAMLVSELGCLIMPTERCIPSYPCVLTACCVCLYRYRVFSACLLPKPSTGKRSLRPISSRFVDVTVVDLRIGMCVIKYVRVRNNHLVKNTQKGLALFPLVGRRTFLVSRVEDSSFVFHNSDVRSNL